MHRRAVEVNFDGLVGPTHHYAGLSHGNIASEKHASSVSNPRAAAKQGLLKMKALADRGFTQAVIPPVPRPALDLLHQLGFSGSTDQILRKTYRQSPRLLSAVFSASSMWVANAATVSPSADTLDHRVHFTPANLQSKLHRSVEAGSTSKILQRIFADENLFVHHEALPCLDYFADEGAANHSRLCKQYGEEGIELFVYGRSAQGGSQFSPKKFPARQTLEASEAIARLHQLSPENVLLFQQNPAVIDQGVFHNDVIAVANKHVLFYHEEAFVDHSQSFQTLFEKLDGFKPIFVKSSELSVDEAVNSYLFNSQLLSVDDSHMLLVVPEECKQNERVYQYLTTLQNEQDVIQEVLFFDLKQSMMNGGGPACLRLRVVLTEEELQAVTPGVLLTDELFENLNEIIETGYRDSLSVEDLMDPDFVPEVKDTLSKIYQCMGLSDLYNSLVMNN